MMSEVARQDIDSASMRMMTTAAEEYAEEELRDAYTVVSERAESVAVPPYEEWRTGYEKFAAQEQPAQDRQMVTSLLTMLMLPEQQTHPAIRRQLLEPSDGA